MKKHFKNSIKLLFALLLVIFISCDEEVRGPLFNDGVAPPNVSDISVTNIAGGAKITYTIPNIPDLLYVEAQYTRDNGDVVNSRNSVFNGELVIEGLRSESTQQIEIRTVDQGNNKSEPTLVDIAPLKAPIDLWFDSLDIEPTFGGILMKFQNDRNTRIEVRLFEEVNGIYVYRQSAFLENGEIQSHIFRGFDAVESNFRINAIDRWGNESNDLDFSETPILEVQLDDSNFDTAILPTDGVVLECCGGNFFVDQLWDDSVRWPNVFHTNDVAADPIPPIPPYTEPNLIAFTIDLGVQANLSRIKVFPRLDGGGYGRGNIRKFEVWGVSEIPADNGDSFNGWSLLVKDGEIIKPSGAPPGQNSAEDNAAAEAGWDIPTDPVPAVRYIRLITFENWEGTNWVHMGEIEFYGQPL